MIFLLNPKRKSEDKWTVQFMCVSVCIFLSENISSFVCLLYIHLHVCVFDRMAWTTRQLWTWSLHVSWAKLAQIWAEKLSLAGLLLIVNLYTFLFTCRGAWAQDLHETASAINKNQMQNCHASLQKHIEEATWHTTIQIPLRKTLGRPCAKLARCRFYTTQKLSTNLRKT